MATNRFFRLAPVEPGPRKRRMVLVAVVFAGALMGLMVRAWWLQVKSHDEWVRRSASQHQTKVTLRASRGAILDRRGKKLAVSAMQPSVFAVPRAIQDPAAAARVLAGVLGLDPEPLQRKLATDKGFVWVARQVQPEVAQAVADLGIEGVHEQKEPRRFYPHQEIAGALLGFAGIDGNGLEGVERDFDAYLQGRTYELEALRDASGRQAMPSGSVPTEHLTGHTLVLTLDHRIQQLAESVLSNQVREMDALGGVVVVLDPRTGDLLAMAQTPAFDPNRFRQARPADWRLRALTDVLEPGSTVKPLLIAAAMDSGKVRPDAVWDGHHGRMRLGRYWITDIHREERLTTLEIVKHSSNVGAVQVAQRLGKTAWHGYLRGFGFGQATGLGLRGERKGKLRSPKKWGLSHLATAAYGYGYSVTPMQMARAITVLANDGVLMKPRLVKEVRSAGGEVVERFPPRELRRVVSAQAAHDATRAMEMVVDGEGGTGRKARVPGYRVAGKTGTANKVGPGGYSKDVRASFVGFVPAQDPRLVIYVNVDAPKNGRYGGQVAAPVFSAIAREALPYLGVEATEAYSADDEIEVDDWEDLAEGLEPAARAWWFEEALLTGAPSHLVVPDLRERPLRDVVERAAELGLALRVEGAGLVQKQRPQPGSLLPRDGVLQVWLEVPGAPPRGGEAG